MPIGTNGKLLVNGKFPSAIGKLMVVKTLATNGKEITSAMIGNDVWQFIGNHSYTGYVKHWFRLVMIGKTLMQQIRIISHHNSNMDNVIKRMRLIGK